MIDTRPFCYVCRYWFDGPPGRVCPKCAAIPLDPNATPMQQLAAKGITLSDLILCGDSLFNIDTEKGKKFMEELFRFTKRGRPEHMKDITPERDQE